MFYKLKKFVVFLKILTCLLTSRTFMIFTAKTFLNKLPLLTVLLGTMFFMSFHGRILLFSFSRWTKILQWSSPAPNVSPLKNHKSYMLYDLLSTDMKIMVGQEYYTVQLDKANSLTVWYKTSSHWLLFHYIHNSTPSMLMPFEKAEGLAPFSSVTKLEKIVDL